MLERVVAARELWCWVPQWRYDLGTLIKCVCKAWIYHPPKSQHSSMIWHCCSRLWMLWGSAPQESENVTTLGWLIGHNWSISNIRMVLEKCMNWLQNTPSSSSITSVIWELHPSPSTCWLERALSLICWFLWNIFMHNASYRHISAGARAPHRQPWQYPWHKIGCQWGWSSRHFLCIKSICTIMKLFYSEKLVNSSDTMKE